MKTETFKCATGSGWGILVDGMMDCDFPYQPTEHDAVMMWLALGDEDYAKGWGDVLITSSHPDHYSNRK